MASSVIKKDISKFQYPDIRVSSDGTQKTVSIGAWQAYFGIFHHPYNSIGGVLTVNCGSSGGYVWSSLDNVTASINSNCEMVITMPNILYLDLYHIQS